MPCMLVVQGSLVPRPLFARREKRFSRRANSYRGLGTRLSAGYNVNGSGFLAA